MSDKNRKMKMEVHMEYCRDGFLKTINEFFRKFPNEHIDRPLSAMVGTISFLMAMLDKNEKNRKEIDEFTEKTLFKIADIINNIHLTNEELKAKH